MLSIFTVSAAITRPLGTMLWIAASLLSVAAGLGVLGVPILHEGWPGLAVAGAVASLLRLLVYFDPMLILGVAIDLAVIVALLWAHWPSEEFVGA